MESDSEYKPAFSLSKWYLDGIDPAGNVVLCYSAILKWHKLQVHYAGLLNATSSGVTAANTFRSGEIPKFRDRITEWNSDKLQLKGTWHSIDTPIESRLIDSGTRKLHWHCLQPKASVELCVADKPLLKSGTGYVEKLEMSIKPWKLPFNEIRWGRYLSDTETVVWIWWRGKSHRNLCFYNGRPLQDAVITDDGVGLPNNMGQIVFKDSLILRSGRSMTGILNAVPLLRDKLPGRIANMYECKWRCRGVRLVKGQVEDVGWTIHEVVRW